MINYKHLENMKEEIKTQNQLLMKFSNSSEGKLKKSDLNVNIMEEKQVNLINSKAGTDTLEIHRIEMANAYIINKNYGQAEDLLLKIENKKNLARIQLAYLYLVTNKDNKFGEIAQELKNDIENFKKNHKKK